MKPSRSSKPRTLAPGRVLSPADPGEWSGRAWVARIQRIRSPPHAATVVEVLGRSFAWAPAADVVHALDCEPQTFRVADVGQRTFATGDGASISGEALGRDGVIEADEFTARVEGEQKAGLLEALA